MKRKNIKTITFYIVLFSLILGACGGQDKEDTKRLMAINEQIEKLHNEELGDLADDISQGKMDEVDVKLELEREKKLNKKNKEILEEMISRHKEIVFMYELEEDIQALLTKKNVSEGEYFGKIEELSTNLSEVDSEKWSNYVIRQEEMLSEVEQAAKSIGDFAGYYYLAEIHELSTVTNDCYEGFIPETGDFFDYEIKEILYNSGDEITLILHHEERTDGGHPMPEITNEETWKLVNDGKYMKAGNAVYRRLSEEEYSKIYEESTGHAVSH